MCKVFKLKLLKTPKPDVPSKNTAYNLFGKDIRNTKKEMQGVPVSKASAIISKEWKKVKAREKKMKKYKDLNEEEKRQHEKTLQRYQEGHMNKMEIINLQKRCNNKTRKTSQPKKESKSFKSDEPKKVSGSPKLDETKKVSGLIDDQSKEGQKPKKTDGKKTATRAGKNVKKTSQPKKAPKSPEFIDSSEEVEEGLPKDDKEKKCLLCLE